MTSADFPATRDIVLVGGGHCHALVLRKWGMAPLPGARLTLVDPNPTAPYTGMLPGLIAGHYRPDALQIDLVRLARFAGARFVLGRAVAIDRVARQVIVPGRPAISYDVLSLDVGITSAMPELPGFAEHAVAAKPLGQFAHQWQAYLEAAEPGPGIVVLGGGAAGVELALAMAERLRQTGRPQPITVVEAGAQILPLIGPSARAALLNALAAQGVKVLTQARAVGVEAGHVLLEGGGRLAAGFVLGAAGARPPDWFAATGLPLENGFVPVGPDLRSLTDPAIFAVGDCAFLSHAPRPKAGVFAVRQAPVLFHNLRAAAGQGKMRPFHPQRDYLKLISTGGKTAVADKLGLRLGGAWVWRLKDRIDRAFMAKFDRLPVMPRMGVPGELAAGLADLLAEKPLCGGCGAKVGRDDLMQGLAGSAGPVRADVIAGRGDDAAILRAGDGFQVITTDHLRAVTADPVLMARIAAVHALGDVWAMGAAPQVALSQITLPAMSAALQVRTLAEISRAATEVFAAEGAAIVGGHTTIGRELVIGFTVTGLCRDVPLAKTGARPGDVLVLTKPIGTGVLLAADMAGQAAGGDLAAAWASMVRPQGRAAAVLAKRAHAMTDVTGFGLAGHLAEMLAAQGPEAEQGAALDAELDLAAIPILAGAQDLAARGVKSSIFAANRAGVRMTGADPGSVADLLFDPQTCGGLLAAVPPDAVPGLLEQLAAAQIPVFVIGRVMAGNGTIQVRGGQPPPRQVAVQ